MKLTKTIILSLPVSHKRYEVADDEVKGLYLRVGANSGSKSFYILYRTAGGRKGKKRRFLIGSFPELSLEQARRIAKEKLAEIILGRDPAKEKHDYKNIKTAAELFQIFWERHTVTLKPRTKDEYHRIFVQYRKECFWDEKITEIKREDIEMLHAKLAETPYQANRLLALLSVFFNWCIDNDYLDKNPAYKIKKYKEHKRQRFLSIDELSKIGTVIANLKQDKTQNHHALNAIELIMFTGARSGEILSLKWSDIDFTHNVIRLENSKTGFKVIQLSSAAKSILRELPKTETFCFPSNSKEGHITSVHKLWKNILELAGTDNSWRIHDLRHTYASYGINSGVSLDVIGRALGHSSTQTTARYAHLSQYTVSAAAENISDTLHKALFHSDSTQCFYKEN